MYNIYTKFILTLSHIDIKLRKYNGNNNYCVCVGTHRKSNYISLLTLDYIYIINETT